MSLERYTELAQKILGDSDRKQKYKGLSNLINQVADTLPNAIINDHRDLVLSNHTLRFNGYLNEVYSYHSGMGFLESVTFLKQHRDEVEQWECDDEATIAMRKAKLAKYAQSSIQMPPKVVGYKSDGNPIVERPKHPDWVYFEKGSYRKYDNLKNTYYYRLGRMIQTNNIDNGDLKVTMQMACLFAALVNERSIVRDELALLEIAIPGEKRQMQWCDISELREAANGYLSLLQINDYRSNQQNIETVSRLHDAIANVNVNEIGDVLARFNVNQTSIIDELECVIRIFNGLTTELGMKMPKVKTIDPNVAKVFKSCHELCRAFSNELILLVPRLATDPTISDLDAGERLKSFLNGDYGDMSFREFYNNYINNYGNINFDKFDPENDALSYDAEYRRLNYLISICPDDEIKRTMREWVAEIEREVDKYENLAPEVGHYNPDQSEPTPRHEPPQAAEATETDDAALPDFSRMKSYTPTIPFDVSVLYAFLDAQSMIENIDEELFKNCITHAHINELWQECGRLRKRNLLQSLFKMLMQHYPDTWIAKCAENLGVDKKQITNPTSSGATQRFEDELRKVLKIKPNK